MSVQEPTHVDVQHEVEQFLFREARLLDAEAYTAWLDLLADDVHYWMPGIESMNRTDPEGTYRSDRMAYFDDTKFDIDKRIVRFTSDTAWAENPPTRHLHMVSNIEVEETADPDEVVAHSLTIVHRGRYENLGEVLYARREDLLRRTDGRLLLARRKIVLGHSTLPSKNLNTFL